MNLKKKIIIITSFVALSGCSALAPHGTETAFKYIGLMKGVGDVASYTSTGKTINDHLLSATIKKIVKLEEL